MHLCYQARTPSIFALRTVGGSTKDLAVAWYSECRCQKIGRHSRFGRLGDVVKKLPVLALGLSLSNIYVHGIACILSQRIMCSKCSFLVFDTTPRFVFFITGWRLLWQ